MSKAAESAGRGAEKGSSGIGKFVSSIARIAKYRAIRSIIRGITSAIQEGLANAYQFSRGIGGDLAAALDTMSTKSLTMKNQMGAAFGALLTNIMPVIEKVIEFATRAANAITQLFAALGGKSGYKKAIDASKEWAKSTAAGAASAKEMRNQLMGFDEINRLDAPSDSGGGGGGAEVVDYSKMFEWTDLDEWTSRIAPIKERLEQLWETLKTGVINVWNYIKEHMDLSGIFNSTLDVLEGVVQVVTGILSGDWASAFQGAAKIVEGFGFVVDQILGFIGSLINSFFDWVHGGVDNFFNWLEQSTGYNFSLLRNAVHSWIETIKLALRAAVDAIKDIFNGVIEFISGVFTGDWERAWNGLIDIFRGILNAGISLVELGINTVISAINSVLGLAQGVIDKLGGAFKLTITPIVLPRFATGGFPEDGLFMANHSELIGQFSNGQTAVANNEQIIAGIERGVYNAMTSAMANQNGGGRDIRVFLDGKEIGAASRRYDRNMNRATGVALG